MLYCVEISSARLISPSLSNLASFKISGQGQNVPELFGRMFHEWSPVQFLIESSFPPETS
jgi:hypothetical protein